MLVDGGATLAEDHTIAAIGGAADAGEDDALVKPEPIGLTWTMVKVVKERRVAVLQVSMLGRRIVLHHFGAELSGQKNRRSADLDAGAAVSDSPSGGATCRRPGEDRCRFCAEVNPVWFTDTG